MGATETETDCEKKPTPPAHSVLFVGMILEYIYWACPLSNKRFPNQFDSHRSDQGRVQLGVTSSIFFCPLPKI